MRSVAWVCCSALLIGCGGGADDATTEADTTAAETMPMAPTISLADVAGRWTVRAMPEMGDSTLVTYELVATPEMTGWTLNFTGRDPVPARVVEVAGDSVVVEAGPYESALRQGVMVTTRTVTRLQGGMLMGTFEAHYTTTEPDSVLRGRLEGTRVQ